MVEGVCQLGVADRTPGVDRRIQIRFDVSRIVVVRMSVRWPLLQLRPPPAAAEFIEGQVMGDAAEPAADRAPRLVEGMGMLPRAQEDLLQDLLGRVPIAGDPHEQREDDPGMAIVQRPQRLGFTSDERGDQSVIRHEVAR